MILIWSLLHLVSTGETKSDLKSILSEDYSKRKEPATVIIDDETLIMTLGKVFLNLLAMGPLAAKLIQPKKEDLFGDKFTQETLGKYFNYLISRLRSEGTSYDEVRKLVSDAENEMCDRSSEYNPKVGNSISYRDFVRLLCEDSEAYELFHPKVKPGAYSDIEEQFNAEGKKEFAYFEKRKDSELHAFVASETGVNKKQLTQMIGFVGLKPDMDGTVIPVTITDNFLKGLSGLESYYINSKGTRKALCTNNRMTRKSGLKTRKTGYLNEQPIIM